MTAAPRCHQEPKLACCPIWSREKLSRPSFSPVVTGLKLSQTKKEKPAFGTCLLRAETVPSTQCPHPHFDSAFLLAGSGAQSDSELPSYHQNDTSLDRGYTSDSEVYADHGRPGKIHRSATDADVVNSGWLVVSDGQQMRLPYLACGKDS